MTKKTSAGRLAKLLGRKAAASRQSSRHSSSRLSCGRSIDEASRILSWPRTPVFPEAPSRTFSRGVCRRSRSIACCGSWKPQGWKPTSGSGARPEAADRSAASQARRTLTERSRSPTARK